MIVNATSPAGRAQGAFDALLVRDEEGEDEADRPAEPAEPHDDQAPPLYRWRRGS
eukprot:gene1029-5978_t